MARRWTCPNCGEEFSPQFRKAHEKACKGPPQPAPEAEDSVPPKPKPAPVSLMDEPYNVAARESAYRGLEESRARSGHTDEQPSLVLVPSEEIVEVVAPSEAAPLEVPGISPDGTTPSRVPTWTPDWILECVAAAIDASERGERVMMLVMGPHGDGKSHLTQQIAAIAKRPYLEWSCQRMMEPSDFFVVTKAKEGSTIDYTTAFYDACKTPGCVIHLAEPNRTANPKAINTVIDLTDPTSRFSTSIWELSERLQLAPGIIMVASINEGYAYTGIDPMDRALKSRFMGLDMELPPPEVMQGILSVNGARGEGALDRIIAQVRQSCQEFSEGKEYGVPDALGALLEGLSRWPWYVRDNRIEPEIGVREVKKVVQYLSWGISLSTACRVAVRPICEDADQLAGLLQYAQQALGIRSDWGEWVEW